MKIYGRTRLLTSPGISAHRKYHGSSGASPSPLLILIAIVILLSTSCQTISVATRFKANNRPCLDRSKPDFYRPSRCRCVLRASKTYVLEPMARGKQLLPASRADSNFHSRELRLDGARS